MPEASRIIGRAARTSVELLRKIIGRTRDQGRIPSEKMRRPSFSSRSPAAGNAARRSSRDVPCGSLVTLLRALGDLTTSCRGTVQLPACRDSDCSGERHQFRGKALFQIDSAKTPERCIPGRALALDFVRAAGNIPAFYDFLQKAVRQKALAMGARQIPGANGGRSLGGLELPQDFERLCEFFRRRGHERFLWCVCCRVFIILLRCTLIILLRCMLIILLCCTIIILLCRTSI